MPHASCRARRGSGMKIRSVKSSRGRWVVLHKDLTCLEIGERERDTVVVCERECRAKIWRVST